MLHQILLITASLLPLQPTAAADCPAALRAVPGKVCTANAYGVLLAAEKSEADRLARLARDGEAKFATHFGRPPAPYAIVQDPAPDSLKALGRAGFKNLLPWITPAQIEAATVASLQRGAEAKAKAQGLGATQTKAAVDATIAAWRAKNPLQTRLAQEEGTVPHEAGHGWYVKAFWPDAVVDGKGHYGGPGPDWLDEMAAVLMESEKFTQTRRDQFGKIYSGQKLAGPLASLTRAQIVDLPLYLSREHPAKHLQGGPQPRQAIGGSGIRILSGDEAVKAASGAILFYLQSRVFADYLIARSGDPAVFAEIGAAFGRGETMDQWLAKRGAAHRLGTSVGALDAGWRAWLVGRFGAAKGPAAPAVIS